MTQIGRMFEEEKEKAVKEAIKEKDTELSQTKGKLIQTDDKLHQTETRLLQAEAKLLLYSRPSF